uniref:Uncharacterized protein n=1 Tax=Lotharella globosa TaxID=91324 RepID=A0A7S3ZDW9_9EUKA
MSSMLLLLGTVMVADEPNQGYVALRERVLARVLEETEALMAGTLASTLSSYGEYDMLKDRRIRVHHKSKNVDDPRDYDAVGVRPTKDGLEVVKSDGTKLTLLAEEVSISPA